MRNSHVEVGARPNPEINERHPSDLSSLRFPLQPPERQVPRRHPNSCPLSRGRCRPARQHFPIGKAIATSRASRAEQMSRARCTSRGRQSHPLSPVMVVLFSHDALILPRTTGGWEQDSTSMVLAHTGTISTIYLTLKPKSDGAWGEILATPSSTSSSAHAPLESVLTATPLHTRCNAEPEKGCGDV